MSIASHYEDKATNSASAIEGNTYATLLLAHHQHTANLIEFYKTMGPRTGATDRLEAVIVNRLGLKDLS